MRYATPGHAGTFNTAAGLTRSIIQDLRNHGFDSDFVRALCTSCSTPHVVQQAGELYMNFEVAPSDMVNETKLYSLGRYVGAIANRYILVHVVRSPSVPERELKVCSLQLRANSGASRVPYACMPPE